MALHQIMTTNKDFCHDNDLVESFNKLSKDSFLKKHPYIHEIEYNQTRAKLKYKNQQIMKKSYGIVVPFTEQELQEMLHEDKEFTWTFDAENTDEGDGENIMITLHIIKE